jgi:hypothetical protein
MVMWAVCKGVFHLPCESTLNIIWSCGLFEGKGLSTSRVSPPRSTLSQRKQLVPNRNMGSPRKRTLEQPASAVLQLHERVLPRQDQPLRDGERLAVPQHDAVCSQNLSEEAKMGGLLAAVQRP